MKGTWKRLVNKSKRILARRRAIQRHNIVTGLGTPTIEVDQTIHKLHSSDVSVVPDELDNAAVADFRRRAEYGFYYPDYYSERELVRLKKIREHYMAAHLLELNADDIYMDVASQASPAPMVYERLFRCQVLRQDLTYESGKNGRVIGGSAGQLPLSDESITKMALHCSLEHFEGDEDVAFIKEAERVLTPGGRLVIVPLYLSDHYFVMTQTLTWAGLPVEQQPDFPQEALIYEVTRGGNRFERYYDFEQFTNRLMRSSQLEVTIHSFGRATQYQPGQMRFAALLQKRA